MSATKRQRITKLDSIQAPVGFHYEGTPCCMFEGRTTRRLRRDVEGTREEIYSDLYCRSDIHEGEKLKVNYLCCISGCTKPVVSMFVTCGVPEFLEALSYPPWGVLIWSRSFILNAVDSTNSWSIFLNSTSCPFNSTSKQWSGIV